MCKPECQCCGNQVPEFQLVKYPHEDTCYSCKRDQEQMLENHFDWEEDRVV